MIVYKCARCGEDHAGLEMKKFTRPPEWGPYTHWVSCPTTGEPILIRVVDVPDAERGGG